MATCLVADPAASGALYASAADPCTTMLALTPAEFASWTNSPLNLTPEDGALVSISIVGVWAIAWTFRALASVLRDAGEVNE